MDIAEAGRRLDDYRQRAGQLDAERDQLIRDARAAGIPIRQIHLRSGIGRTTIYRVLGVEPVPGEGPADLLDPLHPIMRRLAGLPPEEGGQR
jgi:hypothetical protein